MKPLETFNDEQIAVVNQMVHMAEDIVSDHYKMSSSQWLRNRYDVRTLAQLSDSEIVFGPYAQIVRYHGTKNASPLGSGGFDFYMICLQDHAILKALRTDDRLRLDPFILYIVVHELIHIIRFGTFIQFFDAPLEQRDAEETLVHQATRDVLRKVAVRGMDTVFSFYGKKNEIYE
ncbi:hypothetical protein JCM14469_14040 [Desulfatiferula olefinivorans]